MQCQAIINSGKQCSRTAKLNSKYCWQHQNYEEVSNTITILENIQDLNPTLGFNDIVELEAIPDISDIIGEYIDLRTYAELIKINPKVYTIKKYKKLQDMYEYKLSKEIFIEESKQLADYVKSYHEYKGNISPNENDKLIVKLIDMENKAVRDFIDALNFCNIFITTKIIETKIKLSNGKFISAILNIEGVFIKSLSDIKFLEFKEVTINIAIDTIYNRNIDNILQITYKNKIYKIPYIKLTTVWKFFVTLFNKHNEFQRVLRLNQEGY